MINISTNSPHRIVSREYASRIAQGMEKVRKKVVAPIKRLLQWLFRSGDMM